MVIPEEESPDNPEAVAPNKIGARALRQQENKNKNDFVIKCSLNQGILAGDGFIKKEIVKNINYRVEQVSKMAQKVSIAMNIIIHLNQKLLE